MSPGEELNTRPPYYRSNALHWAKKTRGEWGLIVASYATRVLYWLIEITHQPCSRGLQSTCILKPAIAADDHTEERKLGWNVYTNVHDTDRVCILALLVLIWNPSFFLLLSTNTASKLISPFLAIVFQAGKVNITDTSQNSHGCQSVSFKTQFQGSSDVKVFVTLSHGNKHIKVHDPAALWVKSVSTTGFKVCAREAGSGSGGTSVINWLAFQGSHQGIKSGIVDFDEWTTRTQCKRVSLTGNRSNVSFIFFLIVVNLYLKRFFLCVSSFTKQHLWHPRCWNMESQNKWVPKSPLVNISG